MIFEFEKLMFLVSQGIIHKPPSDKPLPNRPIIEGAFLKGMYQGAPGKDIFFALSNISEKQEDELAEKFSKLYLLKKAPSDHVGYAACIRYIYGQFEKQGIHRSGNDYKRMKKESNDWSRSRKFMDKVRYNFEKDNNYYGLCIYHEMEAHRLGDEAVINKDVVKLYNMEKHYIISVENALKCNSYKHMFTPYYWASMYFMKFPEEKKAIEYCMLTIKNADKYCPDKRKSYAEKIYNCLKYMKSNYKDWGKYFKGCKKTIKNPCVKKAFNLI